MPYCTVENLATVSKTNTIRQNAIWLCKNHCCENTAPSLGQHCAVIWAAPKLLHSAILRLQLLLKSPADLWRDLIGSEILLSYASNLVAFWMHFHNYRSFVEHLRMLMQSLRGHSSSPGRSWKIKKYFEVLMRSPGVSWTIACSFWTNWHFADILYSLNLSHSFCPLYSKMYTQCSPQLPYHITRYWHCTDC